MSAYAAGSAMSRLPTSVSPEMTRLQPRFSTKLPITYWKLSTAVVPRCAREGIPEQHQERDDEHDQAQPDVDVAEDEPEVEPADASGHQTSALRE